MKLFMCLANATIFTALAINQTWWVAYLLGICATAVVFLTIAFCETDED